MDLKITLWSNNERALGLHSRISDEHLNTCIFVAVLPSLHIPSY